MSKNDEEKEKCPVDEISSQDMERMMNMFNKLQPGDSMLYGSYDGTLISTHRESQPLDNDGPTETVLKGPEGNDVVVIRRTFRDPEGNKLIVNEVNDFAGDKCEVYCMSFVSYTPNSKPASEKQETEDKD